MLTHEEQLQTDRLQGNECLLSSCDVTDMHQPIGRHIAPDNIGALTKTYDVHTVRNNVPSESMCTE